MLLRTPHEEKEMTDRIARWQSEDGMLVYNAQEAAAAAGLEWEPELLPVPVPAGRGDREQLREMCGKRDNQVDHSIFVDASQDYNLMLRSDTGELLSVAKATYFPLYNRQVNHIADRLVERFGFVWDGINVFNSGRTIIYTLWHPDGSWTVAGDHSPQQPFINLINSHDGSSAFHVVPSAFRPACANVVNTLKLRARAQKLSLSVRHTRQITNMENITAAVFELVERGLGQLGELRNVSEALAIANPVSISKFVDGWLPMPERPELSDADALDSWGRKVDRVQRYRDRFYAAVDSETMAGDIFSPYALWQAAIEVDQHEFHVRGLGARARRNLTGGSEYSDRALQVAAQMAGVLV